MYQSTYPSICAPIHPSMQVVGGAVVWGVGGEGKVMLVVVLNIK